MLRIWGRENSINVQKVVWCAAELDLAFERIDLGGAFGGLDRPEYLAMNPNGLVPTIEDGTFVLWESNAILRYLTATYSPGGLWPEQPAARALADKWMDWQVATLQTLMRDLFFGLIRPTPENSEPAKLEAARQQLLVWWRLLDTHLEGRDYICGPTLTMGDFPLGCYAYRWLALPIERPKMPNLEAWHERLAARPAFRQHVMKPLT